MPQSTPEQEKIRSIRNGTNAIAANAGTGKTHSLAELVVAFYEHEEKLMFPDAVGRVDGDEQRRILQQITAVTFTRDAARELSERILRLFDERGIPRPTDRWGRPYPMCRTLDSYVLRWFRKGIVFNSWMKADPDFQHGINRALELMPPTLSQHLGHRRSERPLAFFRRWQWIVGEDVLALVLDAIVRDADQAEPVPGLTPIDQWESEWVEWLRSYSPDLTSPRPDPWGAAFWAKKLAAFNTYQQSMYTLRDQYNDGALASDPKLPEHLEHLHAWERIQMIKREFGSVYELARARGYHPIRHKHRMMNLAVLRELAAGEYVFTFSDFHRLALRLYSAKVLFLMLDHADLLNLFVEATEANLAILERGKEYPTLGIRSKYAVFDEFQDNNQFQIRVVELWEPLPGIVYCVVACGDGKQAVYAFKGASAYGFAALIERIKRRSTENFYTLTCSFRSLPEIVTFGNEIVSKLPHYKDTVYSSTTIYTASGKVVVFPPIATAADEAVMAFRHIEELLHTTDDTIMVLHRNNLRDHPISQSLSALNSPRVTMMTMHRSKGLQADHVFVLGLTAGVLPDVRSSFTQEVNLFYVACTRPRKALYLSAPYTKPAVDKVTGAAYNRDVGPSVFFARLEMLTKMADEAGWPSVLIDRGESYMREAQGFHLARTEAHERQLRRWWQTYYPEIPIADADDDQPRDETGGCPPPAVIRDLPRRTIWEQGSITSFAGPGVAGRQDSADVAKLRDRVFTRLRDAFLKNGEVPRNLKREEFTIAVRSKWIFKGNGRSQFSATFIEIARQLLPAQTP